MRLIDADSLLLRMEKRADCEPVGHFRTIKRMMKMVEEEPTVDHVKHGKWIPCVLRRSMGEMHGMRCSVCNKEEVRGSLSKDEFCTYHTYCRKCGAKMDEEVGND